MGEFEVRFLVQIEKAVACLEAIYQELAEISASAAAIQEWCESEDECEE